MNQYILFEFDGVTCVAKKQPFTKEERLNGFFYYDLEHVEEDEYFPAYIRKDAILYYWGSIMTSQPIDEVERYGSLALFDLDEDEDGAEIYVPHESFVTDVHFYDLNFYYQESENCILSKSTDFHSILAVWECIDPYFYSPEETRMDRVWSMPNKNPYILKPVKELLKEELKGGFVIDPFANESRWAHLTNDLNPEMDTNYHLDAYNFLQLFPNESVDVVLFEPPYSPRQTKELYESVGLDTQSGKRTRSSYWSLLKKEVARVLRVGGKAISFGWNSGGMNNKKLFHINRIRLVPHGGAHNDTIITVSVKVAPLQSNDITCPASVGSELDQHLEPQRSREGNSYDQ